MSVFVRALYDGQNGQSSIRTVRFVRQGLIWILSVRQAASAIHTRSSHTPMRSSFLELVESSPESSAPRLVIARRDARPDGGFPPPVERDDLRAGGDMLRDGSFGTMILDCGLERSAGVRLAPVGEWARQWRDDLGAVLERSAL